MPPSTNRRKRCNLLHTPGPRSCFSHHTPRTLTPSNMTSPPSRKTENTKNRLPLMKSSEAISNYGISYNTLHQLFVDLLPVRIVFPRLLGEDEFHLAKLRTL